jgi:hypothetical protein
VGRRDLCVWTIGSLWISTKARFPLAQQIGSNNFILQTDCAYVADTMKNGGYFAKTSAAIYDYRNNFWSGFHNVSIKYYKKS